MSKVSEALKELTTKLGGKPIESEELGENIKEITKAIDSIGERNYLDDYANKYAFHVSSISSCIGGAPYVILSIPDYSENVNMEFDLTEDNNISVT